MANRKTASERYNDRMGKLMDKCRRIERERLEHGEEPNLNLTSPDTAAKYGWVVGVTPDGRRYQRLTLSSVL